MELRPEEARVLGCLIEKQAATPEQYPLTLNALRLACNQSTNRHPVVAYDDRTVETALMQLKSTGLVRFVLPGHGARTTRYRHTANDRWHLGDGELGVLAALVLRGPQTVGALRTKLPNGAPVEEYLDALAARSPEAFATRLERRPGEREPRWAHLLCGEPQDLGPDLEPEPPPHPELDVATQRNRAVQVSSSDWETLEIEVAELRARLDRLERLLGVEPGR